MVLGKGYVLHALFTTISKIWEYIGTAHYLWWPIKTWWCQCIVLMVPIIFIILYIWVMSGNQTTKGLSYHVVVHAPSQDVRDWFFWITQKHVLEIPIAKFKEICNNRCIHVTVLEYQHCTTESIEAYLYNFHNLFSMTVLFPKLQLAACLQ